MRQSARPVITLTTDFGWQDSYAGELKIVLARLAPEARIIDITHSIPPQDVAAASFVLERLISHFQGAGVHLAVVDPGVGSARRALLARVKEQVVVCPDNGLITWAARWYPDHFSTYEILWRPDEMSATFHGRDLFAPVAAMVANGEFSEEKHCRPIADPVLLPMDFAKAGAGRGEVIYVDHYGNAVTNVRREAIGEPPKRVVIKNRDIGPIRETYAAVIDGEPLALIGSSGLLEIAIRNGSAAHALKIAVGDVVGLA
jgi:S-adenosylmethionine hydrolase